MIVFEAGTGKNKITVEERPDGTYSADFGRWGRSSARTRSDMEGRLAREVYARQRKLKVKVPWGEFRPYPKSTRKYSRVFVRSSAGEDYRAWEVSPEVAVAKEPGANRYRVIHRPTGLYITSLQGIPLSRALAAAEAFDTCIDDPQGFASSDPRTAAESVDKPCLHRVMARAFLT